MTFENRLASGQLQGEMNVTPLIDVLLVLLIIFMVIAPVMQHGLQAALPRTSENARPNTPIVVQIMRTSEGRLGYKINQDEVSLHTLGTRLGTLFSSRADRTMFVQGEGDLDFSTIAEIVDIGKGAGADHVGLIPSQGLQ